MIIDKFVKATYQAATTFALTSRVSHAIRGRFSSIFATVLEFRYSDRRPSCPRRRAFRMVSTQSQARNTSNRARSYQKATIQIRLDDFLVYSTIKN